MPQLTARRGPGARRRVATKLSEIPDDQLACRARHLWPSDELETGKPIPLGLAAYPQSRNGVYRIEDTCPRCGKVRWQLTLPDRVLDPGASWHYIDPLDWVKIDADLEVTRRELRAENVARNAGRIFG